MLHAQEECVLFELLTSPPYDILPNGIVLEAGTRIFMDYYEVKLFFQGI